MDEMKLRGYVTPSDFSGTDTERLQNAVDTAIKKDIRKVIIAGEYTTEKPIVLGEQIHIVFDNAAITAKGDFPVFVNANFVADNFHHSYSFQEDMFFIEGSGTVNGSILFYNAYRVVIQNLNINGDLVFEFTNEVRLENLNINGDRAVSLLRGCNNFIMQYLKVNAKTCGFTLDTAATDNDYVVGKDTSISEVIIKDCDIVSPVAVALEADENSKIFNSVIEDNAVSAVGLTLSKRTGNLEGEHYRDLTAVGFKSPMENPIEVYSETKHCLIK